MPTQEERLTTVEHIFNQFKAEATMYYQEMALQVTVSKGLTEDTVKRLMQLRVQVDKRFDHTDQQFIEVKQELATFRQDLTTVKQEFTTVKQDLTTVKQEFTTVRQDLTTVKQEFTTVKQELTSLKQNMNNVQATLALILSRLPEKA